MKKINAITLALLLLFGIFSFSAFADNTVYSEGFFYYTIEDDSITIVGYFGTETEVTVPASIAGYPVNAIASGAFAGTNVQILHLPDTIRAVEEGATGSAGVSFDNAEMQDAGEAPSSSNSSGTASAADSSVTVLENASSPGNEQTSATGSNEEVMAEEPPEKPITTPSPTATPSPTPAPTPTPEPTADPTPEPTDEPTPEPTPEAETPAPQKSGSALGRIIGAAVLVCGGAAVVLLRKKGGKA